MGIQKNGAHRIIKTVLAMGAVLLAFFVQGAVVVVNGLDGIASAVVRGAIIWGVVLLTAASSGRIVVPSNSSIFLFR